jgi:hypothetical protein
MLKYWIWLAERSSVSDEQKVALLEHFLTPEEIYSADRFDMVEGLTEKGLESLRDRDLTEATAILARCRKGEISLLTYGDRTYPQRLREIPDPPMVLYYKGTLPDFDRLPVIGVVGTRRASGYGLQTAALLGGQIAACGGLVVSGMAEHGDLNPSFCATQHILVYDQGMDPLDRLQGIVRFFGHIFHVQVVIIDDIPNHFTPFLHGHITGGKTAAFRAEIGADQALVVRFCG